MIAEPTIIQTPDGESHSTGLETLDQAVERLSKDYLVQKLGNVARIVRPWKFDRAMGGVHDQGQEAKSGRVGRDHEL